jgi:hypothetical protein
VKGENNSNEYVIGDVVDQYEVKGIVGRGLQSFLFCFINVLRIVWSSVFVSSY